MDRFDKMVSSPWAFLALAWVVGFLLGTRSVSCQVPPGESWRTLTTEHFRITHPDGLQELAERVGDRAERAWDSLSALFIDPPRGRVDLVVTDHTDVSNGYSQVFPSNRIVVHAVPPVDGFDLPYMDEWMELVVTHELAHVFHQDFTTGLGKPLRAVFGRVPLEWPFFPGGATPDWVIEGLATYYESRLTQAGRVRGSFHEMVIRTAVLEGRFESLDQASGDSPVWPGGLRYYVYGSMFLDHLARLYGSEALGAFVREVAGQWIPYRLDTAARKSFGVSFSEAWADWESSLETRYRLLRDSLAARAPLTRGEELSRAGYYAWSPEPSPDGTLLAFARVDGRSDPQIRVLDLASGKEGKLVRTNNLSQLSWTPAGEIVFSQVEYTDSYHLYGDLFRVDRGGRVTRITDGLRLDHPDVSPDGATVVAVQEGGGSNRLVVVDLDTGDVRPLVASRPDQLWAYPRWSPDGRWIAASRWRPGAFFDVVLLDSTGAVRWEITNERGIDNAPAWNPDGGWLLWSSDRSGVPNLFAVPVDPVSGEPGALRQVTNFLGGGAFPSVDPQGRWIYYSAYHADGWSLERIPYRPETWFEPFPRDPRFRPDPGVTMDPGRYRARADGSEGPYDPLRTLRPTYWAPSYREGDFAGTAEVLGPGYGIFTSGEDLVGRHAYSLGATFARGEGSVNGRVSYSYGGLENPVFTVAAAQSHDAASRPWAGITEGGDTVPIFLVERDRALSLGVGWLKRRARFQSTLTLSASHIWESRFFLEDDLSRSDRFRLSRPELRLGEIRAITTFGTARSYPFSISPEEGAGVVLRARLRRDLTVADSLRSAAGYDRSYQDLVGSLTLYKGFHGPGFANHVVGFRSSGGVAGGPGADASHFEVGGASGLNPPLEFIDLGQGLLFPVRGYPTARRFGRYAWSASVEYRFPIALVNRGPGLLPLHLDWASGTVFFDAGNAWGPDRDFHGFENPRRETLSSVGAEATFRVLPLWFQEVDLRFGMARTLAPEREVVTYLRLGASF